MTILIVLLILVVLVGAYVLIYNRLVTLRTHAQESWSQIDVQLQRRNDLIPNLLATVKGYAKYEAATLTKVTELRSKLTALPDDAHQEKMAVSNQLTTALDSITAVAENYPDLKASSEYGRLMEELANTENKIAYSRQLYNSTVATFDASIQTFPTNLVAKAHHFTAMDYLKVPESAKEAPKVNFD